MTGRVSFVLLLPLLMAACGDSPTAPDDTSTVAATVSPTVFEGTLGVNESRFYSFTVSESGAITAYVASLALVGHRDALVVPVRLAVVYRKARDARSPSPWIRRQHSSRTSRQGSVWESIA